MAPRDALYVGRGTKSISFTSADAKAPARYYLLSYPAHAAHPTVHVKQSDAETVSLSSPETANARTIYKLIHPAGVKSCQLVMGFTVLESGCVWNTMPPHTHPRRIEAYLYFDMPAASSIYTRNSSGLDSIKREIIPCSIIE